MTNASLLTSLLCATLCLGQQVAAETLFVTAERAPLMSEAKLGAKPITQLTRSTALTLIEKQGLWVKVQTASKAEGYVSRLVLSANKPVGKSDLLNDLEQPSAEKLSRRRPAGNSDTVASTRGLSSDSFLARKRGNTDFYKRDIEEIEALEKSILTDQELSKFSKSANLNP